MIFTFVTSITQTAMSNSKLELFVICEILKFIVGIRKLFRFFRKSLFVQ